MQKSELIDKFWLPAVIIILYLAAVSFRPLLPIDETRYMTVAWEMFLRHGWLEPLTLNFENYHHKPPLLFWLINLSWSLFGVSRWAALIPVSLLSFVCIKLTVTLGKMLFPSLKNKRHHISLTMVSSAPFLIYGTLIMFDITLTVFVLLSLINLIKYSRTLQLRYAVLMGLFLGLGLLTKGPVTYLYVMYPALLAPLWMKEEFPKPHIWATGCLVALLISAAIVLCWLIPVLLQANSDFAFWLVWNQTAGRITGNFDDAHVRPFTFYIPLLPLMIFPWLLFPSFWKSLKEFKVSEIYNFEGSRFLYCWLTPVFISLCLISGKQPHYLVPLLPGFVLIIALALQDLSTRIFAIIFSISLLALLSGQAIASQKFLKLYDQKTIANYVQEHPEYDWAFVRNYHGEIGFLARLEKPIVNLEDMKSLPNWFKDHPNGRAIIKYTNPEDVATFRTLFDQNYRGKRIGIFAQK